MKRFMQICGLLFGFLLSFIVIFEICMAYGSCHGMQAGDAVALFQSTIEAFACFVAILGAFIAWEEYRNAHRPILLVRIKKEYHYSKSEFRSESISYVLVNEGTMPAQDVIVNIHPGIPWPMASHPAGDPQQELRERKVTYLSPKAEVTLIFTGRGEYEEMLSATHCGSQSVSIEYSRPEHRKRETVKFHLDPTDIAYLAANAVADPL